MSEQVNEQITDQQKVPTKEELIAFFKEQIDVKKYQLELQELNTKLAVGRAEELKALSFIGQITNPSAQQNSQSKTHVITQEDMDANPELSQQGFKVGDEVLVSTNPEEMPIDTKQRKLKKEKV